MIIKHLLAHKKQAVVISVIYTLILTYLCLSTPTGKINLGSQSDKFYHALAYFIFTTLWYAAFRFTFFKPHKIALVFTVVLAFLYGVLIEFSQHFFTVNRQGDFYDVIANLLGTLIAGILIILINHKTVKKLI